MIWFLYSILGILFSSLENIIDKKIIIGKEKKIDSLVASFYRNICFYICLLLIGITGFFGTIDIFFSLSIVIWSFFHIFSSIVYDYFLKKSEIIRFSSITLIFPIILIISEKYILKNDLTILNIIAILFLVIGGYIITLNPNEKKNVFSLYQWGLILFKFIVAGSQFFIFKYLNQNLGINEISFYASTWIFVTLFFIIAILLQNKTKIVYETAKYNYFFIKTMFSKFFDALGGIFVLKAISLSSVSNVYSINAFSPLINLTLILIITYILKIDLKENLDKNNLSVKILGILIICFGSFLILK